MDRNDSKMPDDPAAVPAFTLPTVALLRVPAPGLMERTLSQDIREEREELREAAERTLNAIIDLNLDCTIKWVSPSWADVVGTLPDSIEGLPMSELIASENKLVFSDVLESMKKDDSRSYRVRFAIDLGPLSKLLQPDDFHELTDTAVQHVIDIEGQGIMVYDSVSGGESHTMWMIRPWTAPREIKIDLPTLIVDSLGSGAEVLASYLTQLAEIGLEDPENHSPPPSVLCRICERHISSWWFEKHTDLCLQEHRAEMDVQMTQESLTDHRHAIVKVLDALEARKSRPLTGESAFLCRAEYKGLPIGPPPSNQSSPGTSSARSGDRSGSIGMGHARTRSFAIRRPQARIVELLVDLCDTAIEINTPALKESISHTVGEIRSHSPGSDSRISQVIHWQSPSTNTLEQEQGLALLCADTERVARAKVEAIFRYNKIIEYAERIRVEFSILVQDCIDEAVRKAARIAAGRLSDSTDYNDDEDGDEDGEISESGIDMNIVSRGKKHTEWAAETGETTTTGVPLHGVESAEGTSALVAALQDMSLQGRNQGFSCPISMVEGFRSASPRECRTPKSLGYVGTATGTAKESRRGSIIFLSDTGGDSDSSLRSSSVTSRHPPRTDSPISEFGDLRRVANVRQPHRKTLIPPGAVSPRRQESPSLNPQPSSPLRIDKARGFPFSQDFLTSPEASPLLPSSDCSSPTPTVPFLTHHMHHGHLHGHHQHNHHRRQSSAAMSEFIIKPPPSPRLSALNAPPPQIRPAQPSIKDFEIIKPISKGAFGSVYLSKKKSTGEYFAIKVLKKADMVAKNQVGNVKAERAIMMWQGESDFVAKLYWTFSSKDYLYLVMEYLNGGDCASLIKVLGGLPEDWVKKYLGEVVLGVEHLHSRGIIHRDLKPDNLLIDQKGHLKLTDFGLSRMGLVGRQKRALNNENADPTPDLLKHGPFVRSASIASSRSISMDLHGNNSQSPTTTPQITPDIGVVFGQPSYFSLASNATDANRLSKQRSDSGGSEGSVRILNNFSILNSTNTPSHDNESHNETSEHTTVLKPTHTTQDNLRHFSSIFDESRHQPTVQPQSQSHRLVNIHYSYDFQHRSMMPPAMALFDPDDTSRRFVGTPDYLAPETIKGEMQDQTSDWWSVGCIMYEFLYGTPPFNAETAELVFENILARRIQWPDNDSDCEPVTDEAKDLINKLLCMEPRERLGSNKDEKLASGGEEIRSHSWFSGINWDTLVQDEAQFVPQPENPEDTEYFDTRGAVLQSFAEEVEDQTSPPISAADSDYPDRPHDALSRVRSQVNSIKRGLMPLHIPPHVRDLKSRRLSEPVVTDDFGTFAFKNLPVLEKANKDVIQKLRAEALASQNKGSNASCGVLSPGAHPILPSPLPSLEGGPILSNNPVQRTISSAKSADRPQSPAGLSHTNSSPSRVSQPSSPLLVSFVAGPGIEGRRKASSNSSSMSQPNSQFEIPRVPPSLQKAATSVAASPAKLGRSSAGSGSGSSSAVPLNSSISAPPLGPLPLGALSPQKTTVAGTPRPLSSSTTRTRSLTVGSQSQSQDFCPITSEVLVGHRNRMSQVFDLSPSSSDNEGDKHNVLLQVQRRRQSSRRQSQINFDSGPEFRALDVLICEDHPVSRMVMEKLLEKLRCRTISVSNGSEAVRFSMSDIKFDIIFLEYKLPQINGADVARMIRETKNANSHTPIVAITAYLKELQAPHYFDSLIEKPISSSKLTEVLRTLCHWRPESPASRGPSLTLPHPVASGLGQSYSRSHPEGSLASSASPYAAPPISNIPIALNREDFIGFGQFDDSESVSTDDIPVPINRRAMGYWEEDGGALVIKNDNIDFNFGGDNSNMSGHKSIPTLVSQVSAPALIDPTRIAIPPRSIDKLKIKRDLVDKRSSEGGTYSADDEDELEGGVDKLPWRTKGFLKGVLPSSKLGIEMMRADSHDGVANSPNPIIYPNPRSSSIASPGIYPVAGPSMISRSISSRTGPDGHSDRLASSPLSPRLSKLGARIPALSSSSQPELLVAMAGQVLDDTGKRKSDEGSRSDVNETPRPHSRGTHQHMSNVTPLSKGT